MTRLPTNAERDGLACPVCGDRSSFEGDPAKSFCDKHYRQYLATFQIAPADLDAYRAAQVRS